MRPVWLLLILVSCFVSLPSTWSLSVNISYSFHLPKELGVATPQSAKCCKHQKLPDNDTADLVRPTVFGIGTQKGGTTTLYKYFLRHPLLHGSKKELHYLDTYLIKKTALEPYLKSWRYNRNKLKKGKTVKPLNGPLFEISPSYMLVPFSACRAKHISPNGKYIVLLRDPTSRSFSGFSYSKQILRRKKHIADFATQELLYVAKQGIAEVNAEPNCDFHSGSGVKSFNDCFGCVTRAMGIQKHCKYRPFITMTDAKGGFECNSIGKEIILRGMYGAQLAWWFTLLPPSQFYILNSADFFKRPELMLIRIIHFLGVSQEYTKAVVSHKRRANKGNYRSFDKEKVEQAKVILREYFKRPNLELYRLMSETGHFEFTPFEEELREMEHLDCMNPNSTEARLCGMSLNPSEDSTSENSATNTATNHRQVEAPVDPKDVPEETKEIVNKTVASPKASSPEVKVVNKTVETSEGRSPEVKVVNKTVETSEGRSPEVKVVNKTVETSEGRSPEVEVANKTVETSKGSSPEVEVANKTVETSKGSSPEVEVANKTVETSKGSSPEVEVANKTVETSKGSSPEVEVVNKTVETSEGRSPEVEGANKTVESPRVSSPEVEVANKTVETSKGSSHKVEASKEPDETLLEIEDATEEAVPIPGEGGQVLAEVAQVPIEAVQNHEAVFLKTTIDDQELESFRKKEDNEHDTPTTKEAEDHKHSLSEKAKIATFKPKIAKGFNVVRRHSKMEEVVRNQELEKPDEIKTRSPKSIAFGWASDYYLHALFACILAALLVYGLCIRSRIPKQRRN